MSAEPQFEPKCPFNRTSNVGMSNREQKFIEDFAAAWNKVMNLDRFDLT